MPKISVLTPLYNTEPDQLKEMIESVLAQSFSDFEFLLLILRTILSLKVS